MPLIVLLLALVSCGDDEPLHARELGYCWPDAWEPCAVDVPEVGWCEAIYHGQRWAQRLHAATPCPACPACEQTD